MNVQGSPVSIVTRDDTGRIAPATTLQAVLSDARGKKVAEIADLEGQAGSYTLNLWDHVSSGGQYR